jgi:hypothetical protein
VLGLLDGRNNALVLDDRVAHVLFHRLAVTGCTAELTASITVSHDS